MRHWATLGVSPPGRNASEIQRLRFVRDFSVRSLLSLGPVMVALFVLFGMPPLAFVVLAAAILFQAVSILRLTQRIRRTQRTSTDE